MGNLFDDIVLLKNRLHGIRRLSAICDPFRCLFRVDLHHGRILKRVVIADFLDETAIARITGIRDHNAVLGTAHIAPEEIFTVVEAARDMGVKNIVVTHPEWWIVGMSHEDQLRLVKDYDVILERCYAQNMGGGKYKSNLADNLELIKEVGYKNVMVDTDGGQTENPHWELALAEYMQYLVDHGIPEEHVYHMTHTIPAKLLGIEE